MVKKTKKSEKEVDIRPMIYKLECRDGKIYMRVAAGSVQNLKPELVTEAFVRYLGMDVEEVTLPTTDWKTLRNPKTRRAR